MKVDVERIKDLYEKYGSLERAVVTKQDELENATKELKAVQDRLQEATQKLECVKQEAEQLKAEIEVTRRLKRMGYDLATLRLLVERTEGCGGIKVLLERLTQLIELSKLEGQVELKRKELKSLNSEVEGKKAELNALNKTIEGLKKFRENLEKTILALRGSLKALNDAVEELKPEASRLRAEKSKLEDQLQALNQQIDQAKEQHANLIREIGELEEKRREFETLIGDLRAEANKLKEMVEAQRQDIELSKAMITLTNAKTLEDIKQFRVFVEQIEESIAKLPRSEEYVEVAKALIIKRLIPKFAVYECLNCHTRYVIDSRGEVDELGVCCPVCHSFFMQHPCTLDALKMPKRKLTQGSL